MTQTHYWMTSPDGQADLHIASVPTGAPQSQHDAEIAAGLAEAESQGCDWTGWTLGTGSHP